MQTPICHSLILAAVATSLCFSVSTGQAAERKQAGAQKAAAKAALVFPPALPGGQQVVTVTTKEFLQPSGTLKAGVTIATTPPTVDLLFFPGQDYPGNPWSCWGDGLAVNGKYYSAIGDHLAPGGNAFVFEYDAQRRQFRQLVDVRRVLNLPEGHYTPGKIHGRMDRGRDGWLYFSTHRGSTRVTTDAYHYRGDWILRHHPVLGQTEIVAHGPVPKHCIPASVLDPERLIFYGGTAPGSENDASGVQFFAYDVGQRKLLYAGSNGPPRYLMLARSTGRVYWVPTEDAEGTGLLQRFDPATGGAPQRLAARLGVRAATQETAAGFIYTVSNGQGRREAMLYAFNTRTEQVEDLGPASVGTQAYITSVDVDPTGRYLYYVPGAHGGSEVDGSPVVQFDLKTRVKKVIAFLHPFVEKEFGCTLRGTFSSAVDPAGDKLYITWNNSRGGRAWDSCLLTVLHIPAAERQP